MARSTQPTQHKDFVEREESEAEFHRRVQDQMDEDSWRGSSTVAARFPSKATVVEYPETDEHPKVYRSGSRRYGDGH